MAVNVPRPKLSYLSLDRYEAKFRTIGIDCLDNLSLFRQGTANQPQRWISIRATSAIPVTNSTLAIFLKLESVHEDLLDDFDSMVELWFGVPSFMSPSVGGTSKPPAATLLEKRRPAAIHKNSITSRKRKRYEEHDGVIDLSMDSDDLESEKPVKRSRQMY